VTMQFIRGVSTGSLLVIIICVRLCDVKLWIVIISGLTFEWVVCMLCFDLKTSGCIGMLPDRLSGYSVLSVC